MIKQICAALSFVLATTVVLSGCTPLAAGADTGALNQRDPIHVPLMMQRTIAGTYKASIDVGVGNLAPLRFGFDTGSTGLHVFADAKLDRSGSGVRCSRTPTSVVYGNPPRIILSGVMCYATLQMGTIATPQPVPIAYLTEASCPPNLPNCKLPDLRSAKAMGGYGVFGAGLTGLISGEGNAPPPILRLPGRYGETYTLALTPERGDLILGGSGPPNAAAFPLSRVTTVPGETWSLGNACLFVNQHAIATCILISFDTGNGVPWIHNVTDGHIPQSNGVVRPGTQIGFGPDPSDVEATSVVAGRAFADEIHITQIPGGRALTNTSIQAFFNHDVTYDAARGVIYFACDVTARC